MIWVLFVRIAYLWFGVGGFVGSVWFLVIVFYGYGGFALWLFAFIMMVFNSRVAIRLFVC